MQKRDLFEYAVIRVMPMVEREEFLNAGIILYCRDQSFLDAKIVLDKKKLFALAADPDLEVIRHNLEAFCRICKGGPESGPIGQLSLPERFRWLTALRSTVVQTSRVHPGFCDDAAQTMEKLYTQLVL